MIYRSSPGGDGLYQYAGKNSEVCGAYAGSMWVRETLRHILPHTARIPPAYVPQYFPQTPAYFSCMLRPPLHISRTPHQAPAYSRIPHTCACYRMFVSRTCMPTNLPTQSRPSHLELFVCEVRYEKSKSLLGDRFIILGGITTIINQCAAYPTYGVRVFFGEWSLPVSQ